MKLPALVLIILLASFGPAFGQKQPVKDPGTDTEKYSVVLPKLIQASSIIKKALAAEQTDHLMIYMGTLDGSSCSGIYTPPVELEPENGTQWQIEARPFRVKLSWNMEPQTAAGSSGYYVIGYDRSSNRFHHHVSISGADLDINALHWQNAVSSVLNAIEGIERTQFSYKIIDGVTVDFSIPESFNYYQGCDWREVYGVDFLTGSHVSWTIGFSRFQAPTFSFNWRMPEKTCVDGKPCEAYLEVDFPISPLQSGVTVHHVEVR